MSSVSGRWRCRCLQALGEWNTRAAEWQKEHRDNRLLMMLLLLCVIGTCHTGTGLNKHPKNTVYNSTELCLAKSQRISMTQLWEDTNDSYRDMMLFRTKAALEPRFFFNKWNEIKPNKLHYPKFPTIYHTNFTTSWRVNGSLTRITLENLSVWCWDTFRNTLTTTNTLLSGC